MALEICIENDIVLSKICQRSELGFKAEKSVVREGWMGVKAKKKYFFTYSGLV